MPETKSEEKKKKNRWEVIITKWEKIKISYKIWIFSLIFIAFICFIIIFPQHSSHRLFQKYLNIFTAWPIVIFIIVLIVISKFKDPIADLIRKPHTYISKGGAKLMLEQQDSNTQNWISTIKVISQKHGEQLQFLLKACFFERFIRYTFSTQYRLLLAIEISPISPADAYFRFYEDYLLKGGSMDYKFDLYKNWLISAGLMIEKG